LRRFLLSSAAALLNVVALACVPGCTFDPQFAAFAVLITVWCVIEGTLTDEIPRGSRNLLLLASATGVAILAMFAVAITSRNGSMLGALVILAGIALRCIAIYTLGDRFISELRADQPLVRRGVYRWMNHPSEIGLLTLTLGTCVLFGSLGAFAIWLLALVPLTIARVRIENAFLAQTCCETDSVLPSGSLNHATRSPVGAVQMPWSS
jgi:protein-S-isoprenylcysteine O-methyltransferase Ste14